MSDKSKTKKQLLSDIAGLRLEIKSLKEQVAAGGKKNSDAKRKRSIHLECESDIRYRLFSEAAEEGIAIQEKGWITEANPALSRLFGYEHNDLIGMHVRRLVSPETVRTTIKLIRDGHEEPYEGVGLRKDGTTFHCKITGKPFRFKGQDLRVVVLSDISGLKKAEEEIARAKAFLACSLESIPGGVVMFDTLGKVSYTNPTILEWLGHKGDEFAGKSLMEISPPIASPETVKLLVEGLSSRIKNGHSLIGAEIELINKHGNFFPIKYSAAGIKNQQGDILGIVVILSDITENKKAEEELRHLRNLLSNIVNSMPSVLVGIDVEGRVTQWNKEAERRTGVGADSARGQILRDVFPQMGDIMELADQSIKTGNPLKDSKVTRIQKGKTFYDDVTVYPLVSNGIDGAVIRLDDISDRVHMEEMMIQSEKMLSVGGIAAGMAHEINNPLAGILQNIQVLKNRISKELRANARIAAECGTTIDAIADYSERRDLKSMMTSIGDSAKRAAAIVENMLSFSRKTESHKTPVAIRSLLDKTVALASSDYNLKKRYDFRKVRIIRQYCSQICNASCESGKIQQVFLNILKNGAEAMAEANTENPSFILRIEPDDDMVRIEIEDNGPGIPDDIRQRIFEPFFTTKGANAGTGLGLSVSYFIVKENHGGTMTVESPPGRGTVFIIRLPRRILPRNNNEIMEY
ncbi:MAG: PAS domain S-box protein [bacterium]|nr:PAS domain S-box protein [bacterium]